ncbi:hypothetical protein Q9Q94_10540 [Uliginosibacterium sp. 31-16]|uniref:hypothetical protein n=1 Tax=Uliginosibacterium sp. 31-16 TaxID=3068315 RepID=UPI00273CFD92|nr:hypothetical protein [Uliginosibacterium sp. 31-16]MDP5239973.1 hypothetical protein [Uliginosibacterium sp. 31-16]
MLGNLTTDSRYSVLRAVEALSNWRALALIGAAALLTAVLYGVGARLGFFMLSLTALIGMVVMAAGMSAAGVCLLDQGRNKPLRSLPEYFAAGLVALPRLLGLGLLIVLAYLALFIISAVLLFLCKIPVLGALLLAVLIPVLVTVFALAAAAVYIMLVLAAPAIWDGHGVLTSFSAALKIARTHPWEVLTKIALGLILCWLVSAFFLAFVMLASLQVGGLSASIIGVGGGFGLAGLGGMGHGMDGAGGLMIAAAFGYGLVFAVVAALLSMMPVMVSVLTWLEFSVKINLEEAAAEAAGALQSVKQTVAEAQQKYAAPAAQAASNKADAPATPESRVQQGAAADLPADKAAARCSRCAADVPVGDMFCCVCGQRMA